jgi:hypothetical protein
MMTPVEKQRAADKALTLSPAAKTMLIQVAALEPIDHDMTALDHLESAAFIIVNDRLTWRAVITEAGQMALLAITEIVPDADMPRLDKTPGTVREVHIELADAYDTIAAHESEILELRRQLATAIKTGENLGGELGTTKQALTIANDAIAQIRKSDETIRNQLITAQAAQVKAEAAADAATAEAARLQQAHRKLADCAYYIVDTVSAAEAPGFLEVLTGNGYKIDHLQFIDQITNGESWNNPTLSIVAHRTQQQPQPEKPATRTTEKIPMRHIPRTPRVPMPAAYTDGDTGVHIPDLVEEPAHAETQPSPIADVMARFNGHLATALAANPLPVMKPLTEYRAPSVY